MYNLNDFLIYAFENGYKVDKKGNVTNPSGRVLKTFKSSKYSDYKAFSVKMYKKSRHVKVHRLQAYQKFGDKIFEEGIVVRHKNGDSLDNSCDNILIGTQSENIMDRTSKSLKEHSIIATRVKQNSIRSYQERCLIYKDLKNGIPYSEIVSKYKVSKSTLSFMKNKSIEYKEFLNGYSSIG